jgi:hypothetical protein
MNVIIERDIDCSGLIVTCTPLVNSDSAVSGVKSKRLEFEVGYGSISLRLSDKELHILLLNQRGLYDLALLRWESMISVSQWLASRVILKRKDTYNLHATLKKKSDIEKKSSLKHRKDMSKMNETEVIEAHTDLTGDTNTDTNPDTNPEMIKLSLDRSVELPKEARKQWKSRNLPALRGMEVKISAHQDLDLLIITVTLLIPQPVLEDKQVKKLIDYHVYDEKG